MVVVVVGVGVLYPEEEKGVVMLLYPEEEVVVYPEEKEF